MDKIEDIVRLESIKKLIEGLQKFAQFKRDKRKARNLKNKANGGYKNGKD